MPFSVSFPESHDGPVLPFLSAVNLATFDLWEHFGRFASYL
jgi:hypothetical protein